MRGEPATKTPEKFSIFKRAGFCRFFFLIIEGALSLKFLWHRRIQRAFLQALFA